MQVFNGEKEVTSRIKCLKGWMVTINAILLIWEHLKTNHEFKFLLTRRLNTDPLENFFGSIRQQGGNSDNPTPVQFTRAFRKLFFSSFLNTSSGNCAEDFDDLLGQCTEKPNVPIVVATPSQPQMPQTLDIGPTDYRELNVSSNLMRANAIAYVSGYLLQKCFKQHCCQTCTTALVSSELDDERKLFCYFKAYESDKGTFGALHAPTIPCLEYVTQLEDLFISSFSVYTKSSCIGKTILAKLKSSPVAFKTCPDFPLDYLLKLFLRMRIYYSLKFANRDFISTKKKDRKYIKITHL